MSPRDKYYGARLPSAHFPQSHPQLASTRLAAQLSVCSQETPLSLTGRREDTYSQEGSQRRKSPPCPPFSVSRALLLLPCTRKSPTMPVSLLPGPHAPASAYVPGLCYNYGLLHCLSKIPHFRRSCKSVLQSHSASN